MTNYPEDQLYGKLPLLAVKDFLKQMPADWKTTKKWIHTFEAIKQYYQKYEKNTIDQEVIKKLVESYENQNHSGSSHGVATQAILQYFGGVFDKEDKEFVK